MEQFNIRMLSGHRLALQRKSKAKPFGSSNLLTKSLRPLCKPLWNAHKARPFFHKEIPISPLPPEDFLSWFIQHNPFLHTDKENSPNQTNFDTIYNLYVQRYAYHAIKTTCHDSKFMKMKRNTPNFWMKREDAFLYRWNTVNFGIWMIISLELKSNGKIHLSLEGLNYLFITKIYWADFSKSVSWNVLQ